ncbi:tRNA pseudouridine(55) synthase TruB [Haloimpatiens sp. FM7315]|uniref:tRNA pseudouridine(55) synthase TruB n=1 Tax=Haloimpatiens sp. FM7315 TaxID=3298609 RepID=UPI00370B0606
MNGVLNIYKPKGITSFDVVREIRKIAGEKKVGHAGTLDPLACGVLPVCIGKSTKIIDYIMKNEKTYMTKLKLGIITDTYDKEGIILKEKNYDNIDKHDIENVMNNFRGVIEQIPPMYSALKVNGKKLYELARKGIEIEREARKITIHELEILNIDMPYIDLKVVCSKGTYIRSLCYDIGNLLGCGATMWELERAGTGSFVKQNSVALSELTRENISQHIITMEDALSKYDKVQFCKDAIKLLTNGVEIKNPYFIDHIPFDKILRAYDEEKFIGIGIRTYGGFKLLKLLI